MLNGERNNGIYSYKILIMSVSFTENPTMDEFRRNSNNFKNQLELKFLGRVKFSKSWRGGQIESTESFITEIFIHWEELTRVAEPWLTCSLFGNVMRDFLYCLICLLKRRSKKHKVTIAIMMSYPDFIYEFKNAFSSNVFVMNRLKETVLFIIICRSCSSVRFEMT